MGSPVCISWDPGSVPGTSIALAKCTVQNGKRCKNWSEDHWRQCFPNDIVSNPNIQRINIKKQTDG